MVQGVERFRARFKAIPRKVRTELEMQIEKQANKLVREMRLFNPMPGTIEIDWTWGDAPSGSLTIGSFRGQEFGKVVATVYATAKTEEFPKGFAAIARWAEFGTADRRQKTTGRFTGKITASPYFFPVYRSNRQRIRTNITRAVRRGFDKA